MTAAFRDDSRKDYKKTAIHFDSRYKNHLTLL